MEIKGCSVGAHTDVKPGGGNVALGGCDVRGTTGAPLKSVDDFNRELSEAGADDGEELLKRTEACLVKLGVDKGMFRSALDKLKKQHGGDIAAVQEDLAFEFSSALNNVVGIGSGPPVPGAGDDVL